MNQTFDRVIVLGSKSIEFDHWHCLGSPVA